ncbi:shikimate kinase [Chloroflexota bacterium]
MENKDIILIGMAGVGKSTLGLLLADILNYSFTDVDEYIEERCGKKLQAIINDEGEQTFLELEKKVMYEIELRKRVTAPGGSIVYHDDLMAYLKQKSILVYLDDSLENIKSKITNESSRGIIGLKIKSLSQVYDERKRLYAKFADVNIDCRDKTPENVVEEILEFYEDIRHHEV